MPGAFPHPKSPCSEDGTSFFRIFRIQGKASGFFEPARRAEIPSFSTQTQTSSTQCWGWYKKKKTKHRISSRCSVYPPHSHKEAANPPSPGQKEKQLLHIKASAVKYLSKCLSPLLWMPEFPGSALTDLLFSFPSTKWNFFITAANYKAGKFFEGSSSQTGFSPPHLLLLLLGFKTGLQEQCWEQTRAGRSWKR